MAQGMTYDERLTAPVAVWIGAWVGSAVLGLTVYAALGPAAGLVAVLVPGTLLSLVLRSAAARVQVVDGELVAGPARIDVSLLGPLRVLDADSARQVRGPASDPAGYHLIRGWVPAGVQAAVLDEADPAPYWFVASRNPARLAAAVEAARR